MERKLHVYLLDFSNNRSYPRDMSIRSGTAPPHNNKCHDHPGRSVIEKPRRIRNPPLAWTTASSTRPKEDYHRNYCHNTFSQKGRCDRHEHINQTQSHDPHKIT